MTYKEYRDMRGVAGKPKRKHLESSEQILCVAWFHFQWPQYIIFAVPNGGKRQEPEASIMKREGVLEGASDLIVVVEARVLFVEMKSKKGKQSKAQKAFQAAVERLGHKYAVCYGLSDFSRVVNNFIKGER